MKVHVIIDFQYNYHKHKYAIESGRLPELSSVVNGETVDTTYLYYTLSDIESYRKTYVRNKDGSENEVVVSICLDKKSSRLSESTDYKSNRKGKLKDYDIENINKIVGILEQIGYNIYTEDGMEADDLIKGLVDRYKNDFGLTVIHTNDSDILVNLDSENDVYVQRYKSSLRKHQLFTQENMPGLMSDEFDCDIRDNTIILYKCLVGDKSDVIKGAKGFGKKAFDKYMDYLDFDLKLTHDDYKKLKDWDNVRDLLNRSVEYLGERVVAEALESLEMVKFREVTATNIKPEKKDTQQKRNEIYKLYQMYSLTEN